MADGGGIHCLWIKCDDGNCCERCFNVWFVIVKPWRRLRKTLTTSPADDTIDFEIAHLRQKEFLPIIMAGILCCSKGWWSSLPDHASGVRGHGRCARGRKVQGNPEKTAGGVQRSRWKTVFELDKDKKRLEVLQREIGKNLLGESLYSNESGRYLRVLLRKNRPSLLNHVLTECAVQRIPEPWIVTHNIQNFTKLKKVLAKATKTW